jgi:hypothetical protein
MPEKNTSWKRGANSSLKVLHFTPTWTKWAETDSTSERVEFVCLLKYLFSGFLQVASGNIRRRRRRRHYGPRIALGSTIKARVGPLTVSMLLEVSLLKTSSSAFFRLQKAHPERRPYKGLY